MPRKDPITGVPVMTLGEFWKSEAEHEGLGREPWELMEDLASEMEAERLKEEKRLQDPTVVLKLLRDVVASNLRARRADFKECAKLGYPLDEWIIHVPTAIISVEEVSFSESFRETATTIVGTVRCKDNVIRTFKYHYATDNGDFYTPPEYEVEVIIE